MDLLVRHGRDLVLGGDPATGPDPSLSTVDKFALLYAFFARLRASVDLGSC
jgi:hypothetical protein